MRLIVHLTCLFALGLMAAKSGQLFSSLPPLLVAIALPVFAIILICAAAYLLVWFHTGKRPAIPRLASRPKRKP